MGTTDPGIASSALDAIVEAGVGFAVLHREKDIAAGNVSSDLDLVIDRPPEEALVAAWPAILGAGLHPVVVFPYEVDELTVFLCDRQARGAAQVDLLGDSHGTSLFGLRGHQVIRRAVHGARWPTAHPLDELLYLTRKRQAKNDSERVEELRARASTYEWKELRARAGELFVPPVAEAVLGALANGLAAFPYRATGAYRARTLARRAGRLRQPAGFWVELVGPDAAGPAAALAARFAPFLVTARAVERPASGQLRWWSASVAPVRWRPGLVVSSARTTHRPRADLVLAAGRSGVDTLAEQTVEALRSRVERRLHPP